MKENDYKIDLGDIICRKAKKTDNLEKIASLIYQTDPYIYPYWFKGGEKEAVAFLKDKILIPGFVFSYENIYVAIDKETGSIIGLIVSFDKNSNLDFDYTEIENISENYKTAVDVYVKGCLHEVPKIDALYIMNCVVDKSARGRNVGLKLLSSFLKVMEKAGHEEFLLDCLLHNLPAKNLYHTLGFLEVEETLGFQGAGESRPELVVFKRKKGAFLENEFQEEQKYKGLDQKGRKN